MCGTFKTRLKQAVKLASTNYHHMVYTMNSLVWDQLYLLQTENLQSNNNILQPRLLFLNTERSSKLLRPK